MSTASRLAPSRSLDTRRLNAIVWSAGIDHPSLLGGAVEIYGASSSHARYPGRLVGWDSHGSTY